MIERVCDKRNQFVDIMRGIAMLCVVLQHTMSGSTIGAEKSFIFNIVWSLQLPLFILISGYVTKYSRGIHDTQGLWKYVKRRTIAYMFPWCVWSFVVRGVIFNQQDFFDIKHLLWHMDSGYWFLATIWTISMIFGIASFIGEKIEKENAIKKQAVVLIVYLAGMAVLGGIGFCLGISFFAIKLTLYYMPFYYAGYLYGQMDDRLSNIPIGKKLVDFCIALCFALWLFVILRFSLYGMADSGLAIVLRASTSLAGCIAVCGLCKGLFSLKIGGGAMAWVGEHSLEIYLIHYLLLNQIKLINAPAIYNPIGISLILVNYTMTVLITVMVIIIINQNKALRFLLIGKKE